jgi:hypothetical protein
MGDEWNYGKQVYSEAEADAWVAAWVQWARGRGRDVTVSERPKEDAYEPS